MTLSNEQISTLLRMVADVQADALDCDGCYALMAELADTELAGRDVPEALKAVEAHLQQCTCCKDEYQTLLEGLRAIEDGE